MIFLLFDGLCEFFFFRNEIIFRLFAVREVRWLPIEKKRFSPRDPFPSSAMRPKFQHENSYACLLAEVLEEEKAEEEKKSPASVRGELASIRAAAAKQSSVDFASTSVRRSSRPRRQIGAATSTPTPTPTPTPTSPPLPLLVECDDPTLPECLKFNRFIQTGYRRAPLSRKECLCSLGYAHNETFNVLSHLVPLAAICVALATGALSATWPSSTGVGNGGGNGGGGGGGGDRVDRSLLLHALPVLLCHAGSVCYHLLMADSKIYAADLSVDVCGILALTVDGTRAMASRPAGCVAAAAVGGGSRWFSPLALLREALVSPWAAAGPPPPSPPPPSLSAAPPLSPSSSPWLFLVSSPPAAAVLARDAALTSYAALVVFAATKALRGRTAAERGFPLLALLLARFAVLAARAAEVRSLTAAAAADALAAASPPSSSSSSSSSSLPPGVASLRSALRWYAGAEAASFVGGLVNVLRIPERWVKPLPPLPLPPLTKTTTTTTKTTTAETTETATMAPPPPPRFRLVDFAFNSHNLMHVFSLVALGCYHAAAAEDRRHWLEHGCGTGAGAR